jgi:hypothetical protein
MINDTADFFNTDDFAEFATVNGRRMRVIFDKTPVQYAEGFAQITANTPQLTVQTADLTKASVVAGQSVVVRRVNYTIAEIEDDGTGISTVFLHEAN